MSATVIVIDVSPGSTGSEDSLRAAQLLVEANILRHGGRGSDQVALVLAGASRPKNSLCAEYGGYDTVNVVRDLGPCDVAMVKLLEDYASLLRCTRRNGDDLPSDPSVPVTYGEDDPMDSGTNLPHVQADLLDALVVAVDLFRRSTTIKPSMGKRVVLATDGTGLLDMGEDVVVTNVAAAFRQSASLTVFGKGFHAVPDDVDEDTFTRFGVSDTAGGNGIRPVRLSKENGDENGDENQEEEEEEEEAAALRFLGSLPGGELSLRLFSAVCGGTVVTCHAAVELLSGFQSRRVKVRSAFTGTLEIGSEFGIPVRALTRTQQQRFPPLSKCSASSVVGKSVTQANATVKDLNEGADGGMGAAAVKMDVKYTAPGQGGVMAEVEDLVEAYRYGNRLVPVSEADSMAVKSEPDGKRERCLKVLGWTRESNVRRHYLMGGTKLIVAQENAKQDAVALSALAHAMVAKGRVGIVRYVRCAGAPVELGALFPHPTAEFEGLVYCKLAFADDVRRFYFKPLPQPDDQQRKAIRSLMTVLDLHSGPEGEEVLDPAHTYNPALQHLYQNIRNRAIADPSQPPPALLPLDARIKSYVCPEDALAQVAREALRDLEGSVRLVRVERVGEKRPAAGYGVEVGGSSTAGRLVEGGPPDAKKPRLAETLAEISKPIGPNGESGQPLTVGSEDPAGDFERMMANRTEDLVDRALEEIKKVVVELVDTSVRGHRFARAVECLTAMRKCCVADGESAAFNAFLRDLFERYRDRSPAFLSQVETDGNLGVITAEEDPDGGLTKEQAETWLRPAAGTGVSMVEIPVDDDDGLDDLA